MKRMLLLLFGIVSCVLFANDGFANSSAINSDFICNDSIIVAHFDLNACDAVVGSTANDYSEFQASYPSQSQCGSFTVSQLYRNNPEVNGHSCTPGVDDSEAMCISSVDECDFVPYHDKAIRFEVLVSPTTGEEASLSGLSFFEKAPETFDWIDGASGPNNYPTKYALRVTVDSVQIYLRQGIQTSRDWSFESYDFSSNPNFTVTETTQFNFEILPYCTVNNGSPVNAWDIDEIKFYNCCDPCNPEAAEINADQTNFCLNDPADLAMDISIVGGVGEHYSFVLVDATGSIIAVYNDTEPTFDANSSNGVAVYHVNYDDGFGPLQVGDSLFGSQGCYVVSNPINVSFDLIEGGNLTTSSKTDICIDEQANATEIAFEISGNNGDENILLISDANGMILAFFDGNTIDISSLEVGTYTVYNVSYNTISNVLDGVHVTDIQGCFAISNGITINIIDLEPIQINIDNNSFCKSESDVLVVNPASSIAFEATYLVINDLGLITLISQDNTIDISALSGGNYQVVLLHNTGDLNGLFPGSELSSVAGCYEASEAVSFEIIALDDVSISTTESLAFCSNSITATIDLDIAGNTSNEGFWVLTDNAGVIQSIENTPNITLDLTNGITGYTIQYISFEGGLTGLEQGATLENITGCFALSNILEISVDCVDSGVLEGDISEHICSSNGVIDFNANVVGAKGNFGSYLITNEAGIVVALSQQGMFVTDLSGQGSNFQLWYLSYSDVNEAPQLGSSASAISGCVDLSQPIAFTVSCVNGGEISTQDPLTLCNINESASIHLTSSNAKGENQRYLLLDQTGKIIEINNTAEFTFDLTNGQLGYSIYLISYNDGVTGLEVSNTLADITGCFALSNALDVKVDCVDGGVISTDDPLDLCGHDANLNVDIQLEEAKGSFQQIVITNEEGLVVYTGSGTTVDIVLTGSGTQYEIWNVSSSEEVDLDEGDSVTSLNGCYDLSNPLAVSLAFVDGGMISTDDPSIFCASDGDQTIDVTLIDAEGNFGVYVVTNEAGVVIGSSENGTIDISMTGSGTASDIWYIASDTALDNVVGQSVDDITGCIDRSNNIPVTILVAEAGTISTDDPVYFCDENVSTSISVESTQEEGDLSQLVLLDEFGNVVFSTEGNIVDLVHEGGASSYQIYQIVSTGSGTGLDLGQNIEDLAGCTDISNPIDITIDCVQGGDISTNSETSFCATTDILNLDIQLENEKGPVQQFVVTDESGTIIYTSTNSLFDLPLSGSGSGLQVWNVASASTPLHVGTNVGDVEACFDLSNPIDLTFIELDAGTISVDYTSLCLHPGENIQLNVTTTNAVGDQLVVLSNATGEIVHITASGAIDYPYAGGSQTFFVTSIASDNIGAIGIGDALNDLSGCFDSSESIEVSVACVAGGELSTSDPLSYCDNTESITLDLVLTGQKGDDQSFVVTNNTGDIIALSETSPITFDANVGSAWTIWNISSTNINGLGVGNNVSDIEGCFDLSNGLDVSLYDITAGTISTTDPTIICNENFGTLVVEVVGGSGGESVFVITDENENIVDIQSSNTLDVSNLTVGPYFIYQLRYATGISGLAVGNNITALSGCFDLSNKIVITQSQLEAGKINLENGDIEVGICVSDCVIEPLFVESTTTGEFEGAWFITNEEGAIVALPAGPPFDFENAGPGICRIWYVVFDDNFTGLTVGNEILDFEGCFDLSNSVTVTRYSAGYNGRSLAHIDFDDCASHPDDASHIDYSEFTADMDNDENCANLTLEGGFLYRSNPDINAHSCTQGVNGSPAMCVSALDDCTYDAGNDHAIRFTFSVDPAEGQTASLAALRFYEAAPETFDWINGADGINNYPTKYAIRVLVDGGVIYEEADINTSPNYTLESFDFSSIEAFQVSEKTNFDFELLPYCLIGNGADVAAWDVDELFVEATCSGKLSAGSFTLPGGNDIEICLDEEDVSMIDFSSDYAGDLDYVYLIVDSNDRVVASTEDSFDFGLLSPGQYQVYAMVYLGIFDYIPGAHIDNLDIEGCFDITEDPLIVTTETGCLMVLPQTVALDYSISPNPASDFIRIEFDQLPSTSFEVLILNELGQKVSMNPFNIIDATTVNLDVRSLSMGSYFVMVTSGDQRMTQKFIKI